MTVRSFPHLGADPTPGDVHGTGSLAGSLRDLAGGLGDTAGRLRRIEAGEWRGQAAQAFVDQTHQDLLPLVERARDAFDTGRDALLRWQTQLAAFQAEADHLEREAATAAAGVSAAQAARNQPRVTAPEDTARVVGELADAVDSAQAGLTAVRKRSLDLHQRYLDAADEVGVALEKAADQALQHHLWQQIADTVTDGWEKTWDWVKDHADDFAAVGDALSTLSSVFATLAILTAAIEPVGAVFAAGALLTSAGALAAHGIAELAGADVSLTTIGLDALGLLPGIKGVVGGVKAVGAGTEGLVKAAAASTRLSGAVTVDKAAAKVPWAAKVFTTELAEKAPGVLQKPLGTIQEVVGGKVAAVTVRPGGLADRAKSVVANTQVGFGSGQIVGTKGINVVAGLIGKKVPAVAGLVIEDTASATANLVDAHVKMATTVAGKAWAAANPREPHPSDPFVAAVQGASR
ncbi:hypothetical protein ACFQ46_10690 [Kineococcus sp. GCM10028916]|uniref:hypothetical protein n=1 Tax=Kineococcus sp. GCM10028916 TaxID=3273394 RepID=UPI0036345EC1